MDFKKFVGQFKETVVGIQAKGTDSIPCDTLITYLEEIEKAPDAEPTALQLERNRADLQRWIDSHNHSHERDLEMFRSVISSGQSAIKTTFLLNGGASLAMLAFIGHLAQFNPSKVPEFAACLVPFAYGVLAVALTSGFTYLSQWLYASHLEPARKVGFAFNVLCILIGVSSYGLFAWGMFRAYCSFVTYVQPLG